MRKKKVSVRDIASECGVAIGTVSRVINNKPGVRADLKDKVLHAMQKYNYNPYSNVPIVDKARARTIKVVMPYYDTASVFMNGFYARGVEGIKQAALDKGYEMTITGEHSFSEKVLFSTAGPDLNATAAGVVFLCSQRNWNEMIGLVQ
jgi:DNA-binding LacI/PurR family transcriptional regulator